jgi:hypothetical protein
LPALIGLSLALSLTALTRSGGRYGFSYWTADSKKENRR